MARANGKDAASGKITKTPSIADDLSAARDELYRNMEKDPTTSIPWSVHLLIDRIGGILGDHKPSHGNGMESVIGPAKDGSLNTRVGAFLMQNAGTELEYDAVYNAFPNENRRYVRQCLTNFKNGHLGLPAEGCVNYQASGKKGKITVARAGANPGTNPKPKSKVSAILEFIHGHSGTTRSDLLAGIGLDPADKKETERLSVTIAFMRTQGLVERGAYRLTEKGAAEAQRPEKSVIETPLLPALRAYFRDNIGQELSSGDVYAAFPAYRTNTIKDYLRRMAKGEFSVGEGISVTRTGDGKFRAEKQTSPAGLSDPPPAVTGTPSATPPQPTAAPTPSPVASPQPSPAPTTGVSYDNRKRYIEVISSIEDVYAECPGLADLVGPRTGMEPNLLRARQNVAPTIAGRFYQTLERLPREGDYLGRAHNDFLRLARNDRTAAGRFMDWVLNGNGLTSEAVYAELGKYGSAIAKRA